MSKQNVITGFVRISESRAYRNGEEIFAGSSDFGTFIRELYKFSETSYSPFFKMDNLCKLGFIATEILLKDIDTTELEKDKTGVVFSNKSSSLDTDLAYFDTIKNPSDYFPSPAVFVYTLPNIVIGEICIRNKFKGENMFFLADTFDAEQMETYINGMLNTGSVNACLAGWVEFFDNKYEAFLYFARPADLIGKNTTVTANLHTAEILNNLYTIK